MTKYKYNFSVEHVDVDDQKIQTLFSFKTDEFDEIFVHVGSFIESHPDRAYLDKCLVTEWDVSDNCWPLLRSMPFEYFVTKVLQFMMISDEADEFKL